MRAFIITGLGFLVFVGFQPLVKAKKAAGGPDPQVTSLYYFEVPQGDSLALEAKGSESCDGVAVQRYESFVTRPFTKSKKLIPTRVLSVYAMCAKGGEESPSSVKIEISADDKKVTHVYVTAAKGVTVQPE